MRAKERIFNNVRQVQLLLPIEQHKRLKVHAAINGVTVTDLLKSRIVDIIEPEADLGIAAAAAPR